jgi:Amidases related to nicotinamidase
MKKNATKSALIVIDMENGFIDEKSAHCIPMAKASIPACVSAVETARKKGIPVFFVKRIYRTNGSDVELTRYERWKNGGRPMGPNSIGIDSAQAPDGLKPMPGDYTIIKPRWSAFFYTELDILLRRLQIDTVILTGTTTPNCIRTTAYDANSLEYNVVVLEDCCSSADEEIQKINILDMSRMGAIIMDSNEFKEYNEYSIKKLSEEIYNEIESLDLVPEPNVEMGDGNRGWIDLW